MCVWYVIRKIAFQTDGRTTLMTVMTDTVVENVMCKCDNVSSFSRQKKCVTVLGFINKTKVK